MINLTSTDSLTLGTATAGAISAHVSWVDQSGTTFTPGRTNTASITSVATTTILAAPAASTLRNAKFISLFNTHASVTNTLTLTHTNGSILITLLTIILAAGESVSWTEGRGWTRFNSNGVPVTLGQTGPVDVQVFTSSKDWTKPTAFVPTQVLVKLWGGGGGGGGGGSVAFATACKGGAGGGGGACAVSYFLASELTTTVAVSIAAAATGGAGGLNLVGSPGTNGGFSSFGAFLTAYGGGGGAGGAITGASSTGGAGGGTGSAGGVGSNVASVGGLPSKQSAAGEFDGGGAVGINSGSVIAEFGGGGGNGSQTNVMGVPATSIFGGSGGGCAGFRTASGNAIGPGLTTGAGGRFPGGAGVTGTTPTAGTAGAAGNSIWGGSGGGAGGNSNNAAVDGGAGGAGGQGGGGGGGGGLTIASNTGGAGGAGGAGYCVVISW